MVRPYGVPMCSNEGQRKQLTFVITYDRLSFGTSVPPRHLAGASHTSGYGSPARGIDRLVA